MSDKVREGIGGNRERAGTDRQMRARNTDQIDHQWDGEYRTAAAKQAESEANQDTRQPAEKRGSRYMVFRRARV